MHYSITKGLNVENKSEASIIITIVYFLLIRVNISSINSS